MLVNSASYRVNLDAMRACLEAGCHYLDLGGLYWMTQRQLELGAEFERAGLLAVLGIGSSPGKTNLMALAAVRMLGDADAVDSIEVAAAGRDPEAASDDRLRPPYAIQTLLDELTLEPVVIRDARAGRRSRRSAPAGRSTTAIRSARADTIYTLHSELATFGESFGCASASFRLSLSAPLLERLKAARRRRRRPRSPRRAARRLRSRTETVSVHLVTVAAGDAHDRRPRRDPPPQRGRRIGQLDRRARAAAVRLLARGSLTATRRAPAGAVHRARGDVRGARARGCSFSFEG